MGLVRQTSTREELCLSCCRTGVVLVSASAVAAAYIGKERSNKLQQQGEP